MLQGQTVGSAKTRAVAMKELLGMAEKILREGKRSYVRMRRLPTSMMLKRVGTQAECGHFHVFLTVKVRTHTLLTHS